MQHIYVSLDQDEDGYPPYKEEELDATEVGRFLFRIETAPVWAPELAVGDVVSVARVVGESDGRLWATEVVEEGNDWNIRLVVWDRSSEEAVRDTLNSRGCRAHLAGGLVVIDVPPQDGREHILEYLEAGRARGAWEVDVSVGPGEDSGDSRS